jgi:hypothetical protein
MCDVFLELAGLEAASSGARLTPRNTTFGVAAYSSVPNAYVTAAS